MNIKQTADLSMIIGFSRFICDNSKIKKPLRKRLNKLEKICFSKLIAESEKLTDEETDFICNNMIQHAEICQWDQRPESIQFYALFVADIISGHDWPEISRALLDVQDYFDRRARPSDRCYVHAVDAAESWKRIWE
jgi:hypothetical protein